MGSGYDVSSRVTYRLMKGRLGIYEKQPIDLEQNSIEGVADAAKRFKQMGGNTQQERMIKDKRRSLDHAVWFSYQGAEVRKVGAAMPTGIRALINPNKLKQDYDDKVISVGFEHGFKCGDVFEWVGTKTHWLIYLQDLTELAYFRGDIRRCSYEISWEDADGNRYNTFAAIKGPTETSIDSSIKHKISMDSPNYTLHLLLPLNENTQAYFQRYAKFYLKDRKTCWRVEAVDSISTPGILEVYAAEYYANEIEDDIANGIVGGLVEPVEDPNQGEPIDIIGETFIKVKKTYHYKFNGTVASTWYVDKKYPVTLITDPNDPRNISLKWNDTFSGQFILEYGDYSKTIVVESLF